VRELSLAPGEHVIELLHPDRPAWRKKLDLVAGESRTLEVALPAAAAAAAAAATPTPVAEPAPAPGPVAEAQPAQPARPAEAAQPTVAPTERAEPLPPRRGKLRPRKRLATARPVTALPDGYLSIKSKPWSRVFADGRFLGITPLAQVKLRPGRYELLLRNPEKQDRRMRITISSEETTKVSVTLP
jgi:hypothetical protein